jgi:hypothetical protein
MATRTTQKEGSRKVLANKRCVVPHVDSGTFATSTRQPCRKSKTAFFDTDDANHDVIMTRVNREKDGMPRHRAPRLGDTT